MRQLRQSNKVNQRLTLIWHDCSGYVGTRTTFFLPFYTLFLCDATLLADAIDSFWPQLTDMMLIRANDTFNCVGGSTFVD